MPMTYATITGTITKPNSDVGIAGILVATPGTRSAALRFSAVGRTTLGPAVGTMDEDGAVSIQIPLNSDVENLVWRLTAVPKGPYASSWELGYFEITAGGDIAALDSVEVTKVPSSATAATILGEVQDLRDEVVAIGNTNDTIIASRLADGASASAAAADARVNTLVPTATTTARGKAELATSAETITGTDPARVTTPAGVKAVLDPIRNLTDATLAASLSVSYAQIAMVPTDLVTHTTNAALVVGKANRVDASGAARTNALVDGTVKGQITFAEKYDSSSNTVTVTGKIRSTSAGSLVLTYQYETIGLVWMGTFWEPLPGHRTKSSIDSQIMGSAAPAGDNASIWYVDSQIGVDDDAKFAAALAKWLAGGRGGKIVFSGRIYTMANQWTIPNNGASIPKQFGLVIEGQGGAQDSAGGTPLFGGTVIDHTFNDPTAVGKLDTRGGGQIALRGFTWRDTSAIVRTVTNKALTSNVATLTIGAHTVVAGQSVVIAGVDATFNGTFTVTTITPTTISYAKTASDVASIASAGTVTGGDHTPFFQTTNTTPKFNDILFWGEKSQESANQDCIALGGGTRNIDGTPTSKFNGYMPEVTSCHFHRVRRAIWARPGCNNGVYDKNTVWTDCGAPSDQYGAFDLIGDVTGSIVGNVFSNNTLECTHYANIILCGDYAKQNIFRDNGIYDPSATTVCGIRFADNALYNVIYTGYWDSTFPYHRESIVSKGTNTFITSAATRTSVFAQPILSSRGVVVRSTSGIGAVALSPEGDRVYFRASGGNASSPSYPEARVVTSVATLVTDLVTTSGSNVVTSPGTIFAPELKGMPVSIPGFTSGTFILDLDYTDTHKLLLSENSTVTASGVTGQIAKSPLNTGGTVVDEMGFSRRHIITKGAIGAANPVAGGAGNTTNGSAATATGTDTAFQVTLTTASIGTGIGAACTVSYGIAFSPAPKFAGLVPRNAAAAMAMAVNQPYITSTTSVFTLNFGIAPPFSTAMIFDIVAVS